MNETVFKKQDALVHEVEDTGDIVLFDQQGKQLLLLNDIGAAVWLLLDGSRNVSQIVELIIETLPAETQRVEQDVVAFLSTLKSHGLVSI